MVGRDGTDHIFLVNKDKYEYLNASSQPLTYFQRLMNDVIERTSTAMEQDHCFKVMYLAINAQLNAKKMGNIKDLAFSCALRDVLLSKSLTPFKEDSFIQATYIHTKNHASLCDI